MDVIEQAAARGYELEKSPLQGQWVWAWRRDDDTGHCCFTERDADAYMDDRLRRNGLFAG